MNPKVLSTFQSHVLSTDTIILAVSGGVDSMVLLDIVKGSHPADKIIVAHFDHSLRGTESDGDNAFVASICNRENITFEVEKMDIGAMAKKEKMNLESLARRERYRFLESVRAKYSAKYILTAHHAVDQTETIIGNMIKGAKVNGLSGMTLVSGYIFRPLLTLTKSDIKTYADERGVGYREDSTNTDTSYDRNRIRHDIIPVLESLNPSIHESIGELALYMQNLGFYLLEEVSHWLLEQETKLGKSNTFSKSAFGELSPFFQSEIISYFYRRAEGGSTQWLSRGLIDELIRFIGDPGSYGEKHVKNLKLERRGERIIILD